MPPAGPKLREYVDNKEHPMTSVDEQPRFWCDPPNAFGRLGVRERLWRPPGGEDFGALTRFRAAVVQNAICVHVRQHKNATGMAQEAIAREDLRADAFKAWNARLCGRRSMTFQDLAVLIKFLDGSLPAEDEIRAFIDVAEGAPPEPNWPWPDRCATRR